jgi:hypothetical protein
MNLILIASPEKIGSSHSPNAGMSRQNLLCVHVICFAVLLTIVHPVFGGGVMKRECLFPKIRCARSRYLHAALKWIESEYDLFGTIACRCAGLRCRRF